MKTWADTWVCPYNNETFSVTLSAVVNGKLEAETAVFTIEDNDKPTYQIYLPFINKP